MFKFFRQEKPENKAKKDVLKVAEQQLQENRATIESLRDYDTGKKTISTGNVERRINDVRTAI